jgi:hypothetical protein
VFRRTEEIRRIIGLTRLSPQFWFRRSKCTQHFWDTLCLLFPRIQIAGDVESTESLIRLPKSPSQPIFTLPWLLISSLVPSHRRKSRSFVAYRVLDLGWLLRIEDSSTHCINNSIIWSETTSQVTTTWSPPPYPTLFQPILHLLSNHNNPSFDILYSLKIRNSTSISKVHFFFVYGLFVLTSSLLSTPLLSTYHLNNRQYISAYLAVLFKISRIYGSYECNRVDECDWRRRVDEPIDSINHNYNYSILNYFLLASYSILLELPECNLI